MTRAGDFVGEHSAADVCKACGVCVGLASTVGVCAFERGGRTLASLWLPNGRSTKRSSRWVSKIPISRK